MKITLLSLCLAFPVSSQAAFFSASLEGLKARGIPEAARTGALDAAPAPSAGEGVEVLHCEAAPGVEYCRRLDRIEAIFKMGCTGQACTALFARMRSTLEDFTNRFLETAPVKYRSSEELAGKARATARVICAAEFTGEPRSVAALALAINEAMPTLKELQQRSGAKNPYSCTISITQP